MAQAFLAWQLVGLLLIAFLLRAIFPNPPDLQSGLYLSNADMVDASHFDPEAFEMHPTGAYTNYNGWGVAHRPLCHQGVVDID